MKIRLHPKDMWYVLPLIAYRPGRNGYVSLGWLCVSVFIGE